MLVQFAGLLLDNVFGGLLPLYSFISFFALAGALGVLVHLAVLTAWPGNGWDSGFETAQAVATIVAMIFNFQLTNEIIYRDQRLRGLASMARVAGVHAGMRRRRRRQCQHRQGAV